jgi:hypothetical protein
VQKNNWIGHKQSANVVLLMRGHIAPMPLKKLHALHALHGSILNTMKDMKSVKKNPLFVYFGLIHSAFRVEMRRGFSTRRFPGNVRGYVVAR